jgi:hypothetical protein
MLQDWKRLVQGLWLRRWLRLGVATPRSIGRGEMKILLGNIFGEATLFHWLVILLLLHTLVDLVEAFGH